MYMKLLNLSLGLAACASLVVFGACSAPESNDDLSGTGASVASGIGGTISGSGAASSTGGVVAGSGAVAGVGGVVVGVGGTGAGGVNPGVGGTGQGTGGATPGAGGAVSGEPLGGYHVKGDWSGFAFTFATDSTIAPADFGDLVDQDGPYCVSGSVKGTEDFSSIAAFGVNAKQDKIDDAPVMQLAPGGDGILVDLTVNLADHETLRIQIEDGEEELDSSMPEHRWCSNLPAMDGPIVLPWDSFNTQCWSAEDGTNFDPAVNKIAKVIIYVPDPGVVGTEIPFDFCVNDIGPDNVTGRGEGAIVPNCGQNVSWQGSGTNQQFQNIATSDNRYQFQSNGWNLMGAGHSISLLPGNGFKMDSQGCNSTGSAPCSFPSIYIGTDADGERTAGGGLPKAVNSIASIPTCLGWASGGTPASDEYNVSYDVWFNSDPNATHAQEFLMVWLRDPPSFQPGGAFPELNGVVIGGQTWTMWHGPNADNQPVTSYVAPNFRADGQAYEFNLKDFIDDAVERGHLNPSLNLIAVMGGMEIWGGAQGASITGFHATVN